MSFEWVRDRNPVHVVDKDSGGYLTGDVFWLGGKADTPTLTPWQGNQ